MLSGIVEDRKAAETAASLRKHFVPQDNAGDQKDEKNPQKQIEKDLGDTRGSCGDAGKAERGRNQRDHKKHKSPFQKHSPLFECHSIWRNIDARSGLACEVSKRRMFDRSESAGARSCCANNGGVAYSSALQHFEEKDIHNDFRRTFGLNLSFLDCLMNQ